ncbi:MarR family transcriptional regulator [Nitriliruptoraceae bacterium ZYF776]|nr:MarR family transcriptional regulator [Profundirhabdus halotolerans]
MRVELVGVTPDAGDERPALGRLATVGVPAGVLLGGVAEVDVLAPAVAGGGQQRDRGRGGEPPRASARAVDSGVEMWTSDPRGTPQVCSQLWKSYACSDHLVHRPVPPGAAPYPRGDRHGGDGVDEVEGARPGAAGPPDARSPIGTLLMRFSTQMHGAGTRFALAQDLHPTDVQAMALLAAAGEPLTAGELSRRLELSTGATTRLIDRLERVGHLQRSPDPADRRRRLVSVTPTARATAGAYFGQLGARVEDLLPSREPAELAAIERFLADLVGAMEDLPEA